MTKSVTTKSLLTEKKRNELISKSKSGKREKGTGKTRYDMRVKSKVSTNIRNYNKIDMNKLFKDNILVVDIDVKGETDNYTVKVSFGEILDSIRDELNKNKGKLELKVITRALIKCFQNENIYTRCSCPDWYYRFSYIATQEYIIYGEKQTIPAPITNPHNDLGDGCKHVLLVLSNQAWVLKVARAIMVYINYIKDHYENLYATIIYPAIYEKPYETETETTETDLSDVDVETATETRRKETQFQKGNQQGVRWVKTPPEEVEAEEIEEYES